jgi:hypothetical protein
VTFWAFYPETKKIPLEEMNALFRNMPWFIPTAPPSRMIEGVNQLKKKVERYCGGDLREKGMHVEAEHQQQEHEQEHSARTSLTTVSQQFDKTLELQV